MASELNSTKRGTDWKSTGNVTITGFYFALCLLSFCLGDLFTFLSHCQVCEAPRATASGTQGIQYSTMGILRGTLFQSSRPLPVRPKMSGGICVKAIWCPQGSLTCHAPISSRVELAVLQREDEKSNFSCAKHSAWREMISWHFNIILEVYWSFDDLCETSSAVCHHNLSTYSRHTMQIT